MTYFRQSNDKIRTVGKDYAIECIKLQYDNSTEEIESYLGKGGFYQTKYATYWAEKRS